MTDHWWNPAHQVKALGTTVYREIFAVKKFSQLSVTAKISRTIFFLQRNTVTVFLIQEVRCRPQYHPRRLLQQIEKWKKPSVPHLVGNLGHTGSIVLTVQAEIGKYACHHSVTAPAAPRFRDKHGSHECTSLFNTPPRFLHMLNFCGRPIPWKFYCQMFALSDLPKKKLNYSVRAPLSPLQTAQPGPVSNCIAVGHLQQASLWWK